MTSGSAIQEPIDPMINTVLDKRYFIEEKIGEGGIGAVYRAIDMKMTNRQVVVKVLLENWLKDAEVRRKFEHEKEALSRLDHPAIVNILDAGLIEGTKPYFVMPYISGQTLDEILSERGTTSFSYCADVIEPVGNALSAAHTSGVLHRDIKPENIIVSEDAFNKLRVRLIDFGIARVIDSKISPVTAVERSIGTVWYVAPEQLLGHIKQSPAGDIYSLGVVAYVMLTGRRPFEPESVYHMAILQKEGLKNLPSGRVERISRGVDNIIRRALAYLPEDRYQDASDFANDLCTELRRLGDSPDAPVTSSDVRATPTSRSLEAALEETAPPDRGDVTTKTQIASAEIGHLKKPLLKRMAILLAVLFGFAAAATGAFWLLGTETKLASNVPPTISTPSNPPVPPVALEVSFEFERAGSAKDGIAASNCMENAIFKEGDSIRLNVQATKKGNLYVFQEDHLEAGKSRFYMYFPRHSIQKGLPQVENDARITTGQGEFDASPGVETYWVLWTAEPVMVVNEARINALKDSSSEIKSVAVARDLKAFLDANKTDNSAVETVDCGNRRIVRSGSEFVAYRTEVEHR